MMDLTERRAQTAQSPRPRIIIVDDIPDNLELLKHGLELYGFDVYAVETARDLISAVLNGPWDAILLDVNLPDELGTDTAKRIRATHPEIPIAFLTAYTASQTLQTIGKQLGIPIWDRVDMADLQKLVGAVGELAQATAA